MSNTIKPGGINQSTQINESFNVDGVASTRAQASQNVGISQADAVALAKQANGDLTKFANLIAARLGMSPAQAAAFANHAANLRDELDLLVPRGEQALQRAGQ